MNDSKWGFSTKTYFSVSEMVNTAVDDVYLETMNIYPNPSKGRVFIKSNSDLPANSIVNLYSITGKMIYSNTIQNDGLLFDLSDYNLKGVYLLTLESENGKVFSNRKIVFE